MIEYGLSVSLESSPRTPQLQAPHGESPTSWNLCNAPLRTKMSFGDRIDGIEEQSTNDNYESISPRVLFSDLNHDNISRVLVQRLDFSSFPLDYATSPSTFQSISTSQYEVSRSGSGNVSTNTKELCKLLDCDCSSCSIGQCSVCYLNLPLRSNHVFTLCGHLFCTRCILKWWDTSSTCPICRAELYNDDEDNVHANSMDDIHELSSIHNEENDVDNQYNNEDNEEQEHNDAHDADVDTVNEYINNIINTHVNQAIINLDVIISDDDDHSDTNETTNENDNPNHVDIRNVTLVNRYRYLDCEWRWSGSNNVTYSNPHFDDTLYPLSEEEIRGLRENRDIAMTLFGRMRFRDTLFHTEQFLGHVWRGSWVSKSEWLNIEQLGLGSINGDNRSRMYEFVIRRGSATSPVFEVSMFGFITDVSIKQIDDYDPSVHLDNDWENQMEYAFGAEVFTPTDFFMYEGGYRSYGGYIMDEGTITTQQFSIPFSHIRRLYRICPHERWDA